MQEPKKTKSKNRCNHLSHLDQYYINKTLHDIRKELQKEADPVKRKEIEQSILVAKRLLNLR